MRYFTYILILFGVNFLIFGSGQGPSVFGAILLAYGIYRLIRYYYY